MKFEPDQRVVVTGLRTKKPWRAPRSLIGKVGRVVTYVAKGWEFRGYMGPKYVVEFSTEDGRSDERILRPDELEAVGEEA